MTDTLEQLARHAAETRFDDLSPEPVAVAKRFC